MMGGGRRKYCQETCPGNKLYDKTLQQKGVVERGRDKDSDGSDRGGGAG